jgi:hypothetical protein
VIRANLLPRANQKIGAFGIDVDSEYVRRLLVSVLIVVTVALAGTGIETLRLHRIEAAVFEAETALADQAEERGEARSLALRVERYQEIAREATAVRFSGATAALAIARIGNAVPTGVWLDSIAHLPSGFELSGGARTIDGIGATIQALSTTPARRAALVSIDTAEAGLRFTARLPLAPSSAAL